jgi:hypothetical protein
MSASSEMLTPEQMAQWLGVSKRTILDACAGRRPVIPCVRLNERVVRFHKPTVLLAWAKAAGLNLTAADLQSPTPSASPTFPEPAASPASGSADGDPLSKGGQP